MKFAWMLIVGMVFLCGCATTKTKIEGDINPYKPETSTIKVSIEIS